MTSRARTIAAAVVAGVLLMLVGMAAADGSPIATSPFVAPVLDDAGGLVPTPEATGTATPPSTSSDAVVILGLVVSAVIVLAALALIITVVVLVVRMVSGRRVGLVRRRVLEPDEVQALTAPTTEIDLLGRGGPVAAAVAQGLAEVLSGTDVRAAVIRAWLGLEDAAAAAGTPRLATDAPADLVARLLAAHELRPGRVERLADLYRQARFSLAPMSDADRRDALAALADVHADLTGTPVPGAASAAGGPTRDAGGRWEARW